ncbi:pneumococcal-type histidine triad protein [Streptococcus pseudopneumoniae]|uniref:pneumococcal-type histidine triad protein n=1 Tax=Streptococcus pseudopneumoniae TaxID=257758 RepID=UPI0014199B63|nr:pneumococcal-type histidine triad protein [Streptococcus pseudopneumoniae]MBF9637346.1 pneumococcal-type histidine triad protein [Streptococcus pseudopneumoniae]MBF9653974.1 pneumococcal-type histidine triad protein [Streptococcus pseudopneumoniae]MBF9661162.1 pneumococcal-type histidine triad protein [Streptococcus pseudopneumoniae]NIB72000.1 pneumococcal-type histidine triad protein [Streptococcus pseudopneumoniae]
MKINKKYLAGSVAVLALSVCSYELGRYQAGQAKKESNRVAYIDGNQAGQKAENLTPDEVSKREGINAEQIVIKITDQGYVTSHGDHYHYYNGKVPYDAIISEELLMKDSNYQLKDSDIVNEIKGGYVIKVNGKYYVYLKDAAHADNIRTKEEIKRQKQEHSSNHGGGSNNQAVVAARAQGRYTTDDGYIFNASDIIEDTGDAYIVPHGNHFHYIPKSDLSASELAAAQAFLSGKGGQLSTVEYRSSRGETRSSVRTSPSETPQNLTTTPESQNEDLASLLQELYALPLSQRHVESDGLVFDPAQITKRTANGVAVPHGDHFHFIPYSQMSALEEKLARNLPIGGQPVQKHSDNTKPSSPAKPSSAIKANFNLNTQAPNRATGGAYTTDDGYVFSPTDVIEDTGDAFVVPHGNHFHYIPKSDLSAGELAAAQAYWNGKQGSRPSSSSSHNANPAQPSLSENHNLTVTPTYHQNQGEDIPSLLRELYAKPLSERHVESDGLVFDPAQITNRTANGVAVPHGDHYHFIPYSQMSPLEEKLARMIAIKGQNGAVLPGMNYLKPAPKPQAQPSTEKKQTDFTVEQVVRKVGEGYVVEIAGVSHYVFAKDLAKDKIDAIENLLSKKTQETHALVAKKENVASRDQEFYDKAYNLLTQAHKALSENKGRVSDFQTLDKLAERLNDESSNKVKLVDDLLAFLAPITHPERLGKPNAQIAYTDDEIKLAKLAGKYTTEDGYIFDEHDIESDEGNAYVTPHLNHSHWIKKDSLSEAERAAAQAYAKEKGLQAPNSTEATEAKPEATGTEAIYNRVKAEKKVPLEKIPNHLQYTVAVQNGHFIIPHFDHYHNLKFAWFDEGLYSAPEGYTLEDLFATVKYYVEHPDQRPHSDNGWGNASDHVRKNKADQNGKPDEDKEHDEVNEPTHSESDEKENHAGLNPSADNLYRPSTDAEETEEEAEDTTDEDEVPQVERSVIDVKIAEAETLLEKVTDSRTRQNAMETLSGLNSSLLFGTKDSNTISAELDRLLALLKESQPTPI